MIAACQPFVNDWLIELDVSVRSWYLTDTFSHEFIIQSVANEPILLFQAAKSHRLHGILSAEIQGPVRVMSVLPICCLVAFLYIREFYDDFIQTFCVLCSVNLCCPTNNFIHLPNWSVVKKSRTFDSATSSIDWLNFDSILVTFFQGFWHFVAAVVLFFISLKWPSVKTCSYLP